MANAADSASASAGRSDRADGPTAQIDKAQVSTELNKGQPETARSRELYVATADANGKIEFTTNGFSPFTFALTNPDVVAEVNGNAYKTLKDAANAAKDGDEITVVQNKNLDLTFNTTKSVKVTNKTSDKITVKFNGTNKDVAKDATETFSYTKPSSGSSGGSSSGKTTYKVTTSAVNNGGVNASPSNAEKGAAITITLSPDKGYKLDKLTVTDGSGKTVSTVKKSDTVYTFTMPASAVKVGVSYVKATETPSETKFNDVSANDWFASAVDYVTGKGMMNGTADNTFSPKANTTRGMVVTVLYRLENQPSTSAASFTDVASGAYYANAVAWANANGIVSGYGSGKFGPNDKVTREQLAAILYRYAQYKKYNVSGAKSLDGYTDAQSVSSYAVPALQWANAAGVVTGKSGSKLDPKAIHHAEVAAHVLRENVARNLRIIIARPWFFFCFSQRRIYGKRKQRRRGKRKRKPYATGVIVNCIRCVAGGAGSAPSTFQPNSEKHPSTPPVTYLIARHHHQRSKMTAVVPEPRWGFHIGHLLP